MTYPKELFLRKKGGSHEKREAAPVDSIKYEEIFRQIYPELSDAASYVSLDVIRFIVRHLEEQGLESLLVRSGVQSILPIRAENLGLQQTLSEEKLIYDPEYRLIQREKRHKLSAIAESLTTDDPVIANVARGISSVPDTDIKVGYRDTRHPPNFADLKLQELFDTQLVPAVSANKMYHNIRMEQSESGRRIISADFVDPESESGIITLQLSVGSIATSRAKSNLAASIIDGNKELYGFQFGTLADSTHGAFSDSRVVTTTYSNEHISAPLSIKNGELYVNPQEIDKSFAGKKLISRRRDSDGVPQKDVESIFRSIRIQASEAHTGPTVGYIRNSFDSDALSHMKRSINALKGVADLNEYHNLPTLITEVLAMANIDAHATCTALIEIGAGDLLLGPNGNQRLVAALLSDSMNHVSISNLEGHPWREPLPITLRNKESIDESRRNYLKSDVSGLRLLYDGLFNTYSRVGTRNNDLSAEELHRLLRFMRREYVGSMPEVQFSEEFFSGQIESALAELIGRKRVHLKQYYQEGKIIGLNKVHTAIEGQLLKSQARLAIESLISMNNSGISVVHVNDLIKSLPVSVHRRVQAKESTIRGDEKEAGHLELVQMLVGLGVVTEWGTDHVVLTPRFIADKLLGATSYHTSLADPKRLIALEAAKERITSFFSNSTRRSVKNSMNPERQLRHQNLIKAMGVVDVIAPSNYLNLDTLLRSFPTADKIAAKSYKYLGGGNSGVFDEEDLDQLEEYLTQNIGTDYRDFIDRLPNDVKYSNEAHVQLLQSFPQSS